MTAYLGDVAALARKDLRLELRARDTLPAMALFVVATLVVFHFALPGGASERRGVRAALGRARVHGAARPRPCVGARERGGRARRARARDVRPQRDLARQGARDARVPRWRPRSSRCRRSRSSSRRSTAPALAGVAARVGRDLRGRLARLRDGGRRAGPGGAAAAALPSRSRSRSSSAASARASPRSRARTSPSSASTTRCSRYFRGRRSSTSSPNEHHESPL